ncbi:MAG: helix-hairpin-helix domain-containing protein [Desulfobacteraceae bacterium]|jgi:comEA protein
MKRNILVLFGAAIAVMCLMIAVQPAVAGSGKTDTDQVMGDKIDSAIQSGKVNINTANLKTLSGLKGIGPERAKSIIDYRTKNGNFESIEDLKKVKGIGDKIFSQISSLISVK